MTKPKGTGKLIDAEKNKIECKKCGKIWLANIRSGSGKLYRDSYKCPNGCEE